MTDTPTPPAMTPEQRAHFCRLLNNAGLGECANQLEADGVTIATLTAERDLAQSAVAAAYEAAAQVCANHAVIAARTNQDQANSLLRSSEAGIRALATLQERMK